MPSRSRSTRSRTVRPRTLRSAGVLAVLGGLLVTSLGNPLAGAAPTPDGVEALDWLAGELDDADGVFVYDGGFGDFTDYGLTLDAVLALALGGRGDRAVDAAMDVFDADGSEYVTGGTPGDRYAGALAKTLLARRLTGRSTTVDGIALETELRARMDTTGDTIGRFRDRATFDGDTFDYSNGFTQALAILALSRTTGGVPAQAVTFLLDQQCPGGGFRIVYTVDDDFDGVPDAGTTPGCEGAGESDLDATALAIQALLAVPSTGTNRTALQTAGTYLNLQLTNPANRNANTYGLSAQAYRAAGQTGAAELLAGEVVELQFPTGAIAKDDATLADGQDDVAPNLLWRSTAQGVLALGLGSYGIVVPPPTPTTTTAAPATTTTAPASTTTSTTVAGATTTSTTSTTVAAASGASTSTTAIVASTTTVAGRALPRTGTEVRDQVGLALLLLGAGAVVTGQVLLRDRRPS